MATQHLTIDPSHTQANFIVRHMVVSKVRGRFTKLEGTISFDEAAPESSTVSVKIDPSSIDTGEPKRDDHLRSPDFFDVAQFKDLTFVSTSFKKTGDKRYAITGTLTMHGVAKEVVLTTEFLGTGKDPWGNTRYGFTAHTAVDRKEFGLKWNQVLEAGAVLVGEKVEIELEVQAIAAKAA